MFNLDDSIAPSPVTVQDLAQVCRNQLVALFGYTIAHDMMALEDNEAMTRVKESMIETLYQDSIDAFKDWCKDTNAFYNMDLTHSALRELFSAVESSTSLLSPLYGAWAAAKEDEQTDPDYNEYLADIVTAMLDGEFESILNSWNTLERDRIEAMAARHREDQLTH
jgi:hypothetical protein